MFETGLKLFETHLFVFQTLHLKVFIQNCVKPPFPMEGQIYIMQHCTVLSHTKYHATCYYITGFIKNGIIG